MGGVAVEVNGVITAAKGVGGGLPLGAGGGSESESEEDGEKEGRREGATADGGQEAADGGQEMAHGMHGRV